MKKYVITAKENNCILAMGRAPEEQDLVNMIPKITSEMLRTQPDQTVNVINRLIDAVNELQRKKQYNRKGRSSTFAPFPNSTSLAPVAMGLVFFYFYLRDIVQVKIKI